MSNTEFNCFNKTPDACIEKIFYYLNKIRNKDLISAKSEILPGKDNYKLYYDFKYMLEKYIEKNNSLIINLYTLTNNVRMMKNQNNVFFNHYDFLNSIDRNYVDVSNNSHLIKNKDWSIYSDATYNFNTHTLEEIFDKYVLPDDFEYSIIAGGVFTEYNQNMRTLNISLFDQLLCKKNTNIFIQCENQDRAFEKLSKYYNFYLENQVKIDGNLRFFRIK
jgi:hypothetical protein